MRVNNDTSLNNTKGGKKMDMMDRMSKEEKQEMMGKMMEKFLANMAADDKQKMMEGVNMMQMMPQMMMGMMSKMMGGDKQMEMPMMPQMMTEMMPKCLEMMLPGLPKEKRVDFVSRMVSILVEQGCVGMSEEEKKDFRAKVLEKL